MLAEYKTRTNIGVGLGIIGQIIGRVMMESRVPLEVIIGSVIALAALVAFIWGCAQYAKAKGHSAKFGLFGLLSIIGLLVLFFLTDRHKTARA